MKTITRTWLSIGLALLFGILAAGSIFDSTTTTYDEKTGEYTERTEDNDSGRVSPESVFPTHHVRHKPLI